MNERAGVFSRALRAAVVCLLAGIFYSIGFNAGYDDAEGTRRREQMELACPQQQAVVAFDADVTGMVNARSSMSADADAF